VVTRDPGIVGYARRKAALRDQVAGAGDDALTVCRRNLKHYRLSLAMLERRLPDSSLVAALAAELKEVSDPAAGRAQSG